MNKYLEDLFSLENKVAIVTGGARGNGKAISEALLSSGATVVIVDQLKNDLTETLKNFKKSDFNCYEFNCDVTNKHQILKLKNFIKNKFNRIDILINNAGFTSSNELLVYPDKIWDKTYQTNLKAPYELSKIFAPFMIKQKSGVIINITSLNSELAFPDNPAYIAFKGALKQLSKSLAFDLGKYGIRVNNIGPGYFKTKMTEKSWKNNKLRKARSQRTVLGRWGKPEDLAGIIICLCSESSSYITGQDIYVDGGWLIKGL